MNQTAKQLPKNFSVNYHQDWCEYGFEADFTGDAFIENIWKLDFIWGEAPFCASVSLRFNVKKGRYESALLLIEQDEKFDSWPITTDMALSLLKLGTGAAIIELGAKVAWVLNLPSGN